MEEKARYVVGIDIGTNSVRAVQGRVGSDGVISVVGYGETPSEGLRRGIIKELNSPAKAIDMSLKAVESMSGQFIDAAMANINGSHIGSTKVEGMIAIGVADHEINEDDLNRINSTATAGKVPSNRETLSLVPYEYVLDGQGGIREPIGMQGARLELRANVVSALAPDCDNVRKACEQINVRVDYLEPSAMAAARSVITSRQRENGVGVVDMGGSTTGVAIYDEGELQFVGVVPLGSNDVTNDLATVLKTIPEVAEEIKVRFVSAKFGESDKDIVIKRGRDELTFSRKEVDEVVEARLEEIFEGVRKLLKQAGYDKRLPEGLVLVGGGAKMRDIDIYARDQVELAVRIGKPEGIAGVCEEILKPEYATAIGLMMANAEIAPSEEGFGVAKGKKVKKPKDGGGFLKKIFAKFK